MALVQDVRAAAETIPAVFFANAVRLRDSVALRRKEFGIWRRITWADYARNVRWVGHALVALGLQPGDRVAILGENRPEWLYGDLGIQAAAGVTVGIYASNSADQVHYILDHSESRFIIVEGEAVVKTRQGRTVRLTRGDFFGEMSLLDGSPRSATVEATTGMRLLVIGQREFWALVATAPQITRRIMSALSQRIREANAAYSACS